MRNRGIIQRNIILLDCVAATLAPIAAVYFRGFLEAKFELTVQFIPYAASGALASIVLLWWLGVSRAIWCYFAFSDATKAVQAIALGIGIGAIVGFAVDRLDTVARSIPFIQLALQASLFIGVRMIAQKLFAEAAAKPARPGGVLVVGCNRTSETYVRAVELLSNGALEVAGLLAEDAGMVGLTLRGKPILGTIANAKTVLQTLEVHGVTIEKIIMTLPQASLKRMDADMLEQLFQAKSISVLQVDNMFSSVTMRETEDDDAIHPKAEGSFGQYARLKGAVDFVGAAFLLLITSPVFASVALLTLLDVGRPIYFWQQRIGYRGRALTVFKFRTMRAPVDSAGAVVEDARRTSAIGHFLRQTRLDELPQLVHILKGEMSFVGPRPLLPADQPEAIMERLSVRPGLTGWAQVNGGKLVSPEDKGALDLWYVTHASLWLDLTIAWMTVLMFARGDRLNQEAIREAHRSKTDAELLVSEATGLDPAEPNSGISSTRQPSKNETRAAAPHFTVL